MSAPESPEDERLSSSQLSIHPALHPSVTNVPVTPGITLAGQSAYLEPEALTDESATTSNSERQEQSLRWNENSYFAPKRGKDDGQTGSPSEMAAGARSGEELLRRLSLPSQPEKGRDVFDVDPRAAHPNLNLSGGIISATICVPYDVGYCPGGDWV